MPTVLKASRVRHEVGEGDGLQKRVWDLDISEASFDVRVQIQRALFYQLHNRGPGKELGNRTSAKKGSLDVHRHVPLSVGQTVALGKEDLAALHDGNRRAGDAVFVQLSKNELVKNVST
jgi:hypothetical protein